MQFSKFGQKFAESPGILQLIDDLGKAMAGTEEMLMLGGGNPSHIPRVEACFRESMQNILACDNEFERMIGNYNPSQGDQDFIEALVALLNNEFGWTLGPKNVAITNGSQTAFFFLFNLFAGTFDNGLPKQILLPLTPEYIGYADVGLTDDFFVANRPEIEFLDDRIFKYRVNFDTISITDQVGAICVSRPTNPTGNVLTDREIQRLSDLAQANDIPLIVDNAYGIPFPNIIFTSARPVWDDHIVLCMSLSKLGLPSARAGIVIANEAVIQAVAGMNAVISLAPAKLGTSLTKEMVRNGQIIQLSRQVIRPYYEQKARLAVKLLQEELTGLDAFIHKPEGAIFLWLWFRDLPITSQELYRRLKQRGVLIVPGHHFFPGLDEPWRHTQECIRVTYSQDEAVVTTGIKIIAREVRTAYAG